MPSSLHAPPNLDSEPWANGSHRDLPQLRAAHDHMREGDKLMVWKPARFQRHSLDRDRDPVEAGLFGVSNLLVPYRPLEVEMASACE
jgi:hypothetical protein